MGVKSTVQLTRSEAVNRYVHLKMSQEGLKRKFESEAHGYTNSQLENLLERMNDDCFNGEGYENYIVMDD